MYFEDFEVGLSFETEATLISKEEIVDFASKYDPQLFHLDEDAANNGPFGQLTSSGFMTLGKSFTQIFKTGVYDGTSMGAWGIDLRNEVILHAEVMSVGSLFVGLHATEFAELQPALGEVANESGGLGVIEHAFDLTSQLGGL